MVSSLRQYDSIWDRVLHARQSDRRGVLVVEGDSDFKLVQRLMGAGRWSIYIAGSRDVVIRTLRELECPEYAAGLVDRDFDDAVEVAERDGVPVFALESRDVEAALVESEAFVQVLEEFASASKLRDFGGAEQVRIRCREIGEALGKLRQEAQAQCRSTRFDDIVLDRHVDKKTLSLDISALISAVRSADVDGWGYESLAYVVGGPPVGYRGKDALIGLAVALRGAVASFSKQAASVDILGRALRLRAESCRSLTELLEEIGRRLDRSKGMASST